MRGRVRVTATEGLRAAVIAHMGLAITSAWSFSPELESGVVVPVMQDWTLPPIILSALFPSGRLISRRAREFSHFVEEYVVAGKGAY